MDKANKTRLASKETYETRVAMPYGLRGDLGREVVQKMEMGKKKKKHRHLTSSTYVSVISS